MVKMTVCLLLLFTLGLTPAGDTPIPDRTDEPNRHAAKVDIRQFNRSKEKSEILEYFSKSRPKIVILECSAPKQTISVSEIVETSTGLLGDCLRYYHNGLPEQWGDYFERKRRERHGLRPTGKDKGLKPMGTQVPPFGLVQRKFDYRDRARNVGTDPKRAGDIK